MGVMRNDSPSGSSLVLISGLGALLLGIALKAPVPQNERLLFGVSSGLCLMVLGYSFSQAIRWGLVRRLLTYRNWIYQPKSLRTKIWGMLLSMTVPKENRLFDMQDYLPKLPLPTLEDTCKRTLNMVRPLLKEREFQLVIGAIDELKKNEGPELQAILEQKYKTEENWVAELWDKYAYLAGRTPLPVHSNFATMGDLNYKENVPKCNQLSQAGNIIHLCMEYNEKIKNNGVHNMMIQKFIPICCDRYKYICSTTRIPGEEIDELKRFPESKHAMVFRKGFMYRLEVYAADKNGDKSLLTPKEIQAQIQIIMDDADKRTEENGPGINPGLFTAIDRSKWAQIRKEMLRDKVNAKSLESVESAVFCVALDTSNPEGLSEEFHEFLTGDGFNRWYDKSLTAIITNNCAVGVNVEHATAEATLSGRLWEYVLHHSVYDEDGNATDRGLPAHTDIPTPTVLEWNIGEYDFEIEMFKDEFDTLKKDTDTIIYLLKKGKSFMKKLKISPDGFMQMALQLAFYRLHRETPKTYETATTRLFKNGRTETIRPVSAHSIEFTKTFDDPTVPRSEVISHLKKAVRYQTTYKYDAMNGKGVDRHLFGLYVAGKMLKKVPKLFSLKPFNESDRLSTSQSPLRFDVIISKISKTQPIGGGFGAQRKDGYGVSYFVDEHKVHFLISSFKSCPETDSMIFVETIEQAVDDMKVLLEGATANGKVK